MELAPEHVDALFGESWAERVVTFRPEAGAPLLGEEPIFEAFLRASENEGEGRIFFNHELPTRLFNRQAGAPTPREAIPRADDGDFAGYARRMARQLEGRAFCLRLVDAQVYGFELFHRLGRFTRPLRERVARLDPVPRGLQSNVFVGNYDFSPFGAHADGVPQFQYLVSGRRRAHFWLDPAYWKGKSHEEALRPWEHLEHAHTVELRAGEVVFWPMTAEHVFACDGLVVAVTFTFMPRPAATSDAEQLARRSAHDFKLFPPRREVAEPDPDARLRGNGSVQATCEEGGKTVWVANGYMVSVDGRAALEDLLRRVSSGDPFTVRDAVSHIRGAAPHLDERDALEVVKVLLSVRAVDVE